MSKLALDIVLLPPDEVMDVCIELSNKAFKRGEAKFKKSKTERIPHISVLMGCAESSDYKKIYLAVEKIAKNQKPLELEIIKNNTYSLHTNRSAELKKLQKKLINNISKYFSQDCDFKSLLEDKNYIFDEKSRVWVNTYITDSAYEKYNPHITIHAQTTEKINLPTKFITNRLAVCHMGDRGTCRKILFEIKLK